MPQRRIKRRRGEGIAVTGPAVIRVSRGVTLVIEAPREANVSRLDRKCRPGPRTAAPNVPDERASDIDQVLSDCGDEASSKSNPNAGNRS